MFRILTTHGASSMSQSNGMTRLPNLYDLPLDAAKTPGTDTLIESEDAGFTDAESKLEKDIAFLENRVGRIKAQKHPNKASLRTYEDMLQRRYMLREKIRQGETINFDF